MTIVSLSWLIATTILGASKPTIESSTDTNDSPKYNIDLVFHKPIKKNIHRFYSMTKLDLYCDKNDIYILISETLLKKILGLNITSHTVRGAGNSRDTDAVFINIANPKSLKREFKKIIKRVEVIDDPKFLVYDESTKEKCRKRYGQNINK